MVAMSEPTEIECRQIAELLGDYLEGSLSASLRGLIDWHIESCPPCVAFVNTYRGTIEATRKIHDVPITPELKQRLLKVMRTRTYSFPDPQHGLRDHATDLPHGFAASGKASRNLARTRRCHREHEPA